MKTALSEIKIPFSETIFLWLRDRLCRAVFLAAMIVSLSHSAVWAQGKLSFMSNDYGCFHSAKTERTFDKREHQFVASDQVVSQQAVKNLIDVLLASEKQTTFAPEDLGITKESAASHHADLVSTVQCDRHIGSAVLDQNRQLFEYPNVVAIAKSRLTFHDRSTTHVRVAVRVSEFGGLLAKVEASSEHNCPLMLPWTIKVGTKTWQTFSTDVPKAILALTKPSDPNATLLDGTDYWRNGFWHDMVWRITAGETLNHDAATLDAKGLRGYESAAQQFEIVEAEYVSLALPDEGDCLLVKLRSQTPMLIDSVEWFNQESSAGKPTQDWQLLLANYKLCAQAAAKQVWLQQWKDAGKKRNLWCAVSGDRCYSKGLFRENAVKAWKDAHLSGAPEIKIDLRDNGWGVGYVYLSNSDDRALIVNAEGKGGPHWLDRLHVDACSDSLQYILVDQTGKILKNHTKRTATRPRP